MNKSKEALAQAWSTRKSSPPVVIPRLSGWFPLAICALLVVFSLPLYHLGRFALRFDLYSHILLIPFISLYLVWNQRDTLPAQSAPNRLVGQTFFLLGGLVLVGFGVALLTGSKFAEQDFLAATTLGFLLLLWGVNGWFLGPPTLRALGYPLALLVFMIPFPVIVQTGLETLLQYGSAVVALAFFKIAGTPVFNSSLIFQLPGIILEIAPECSGIHATLALFITSIVAGKYFLSTPWKRLVLALAVVPIALFRNGLRVFTIGELCVHISPDMINSYIHRHGGPIFFAISLVPFFLLLRSLYKSDQLAKPTPA